MHLLAFIGLIFMSIMRWDIWTVTWNANFWDSFLNPFHFPYCVLMIFNWIKHNKVRQRSTCFLMSLVFFAVFRDTHTMRMQPTSQQQHKSRNETLNQTLETRYVLCALYLWIVCACKKFTAKTCNKYAFRVRHLYLKLFRSCWYC